jgi:hypothetical protein
MGMTTAAISGIVEPQIEEPTQVISVTGPQGIDLPGITTTDNTMRGLFGTKPPYKYQEDVIIAEIAAYVDKTYGGHYVGDDNIQSLDLILATGHATGFNIGNILKYASRYGKKHGCNRDDLLKVIHYAIFELFNMSRKSVE